MGGSRLGLQTERRIIELYWDEGVRTASKILEHLEAENQNRQKEGLALWVVPLSPRTVHRVINESKERFTIEMAFEGTPWSLAKMDKAGIPWEESPMLLRIKKFLIDGQIEQVEPLTVGVAKWCYRIKKAACELTDGQVWHFAWDYARYERNAKLSNTEADSSYWDAELAIKPWASEENRQRFAEWEVSRFREFAPIRPEEGGQL